MPQAQDELKATAKGKHVTSAETAPDLPATRWPKPLLVILVLVTAVLLVLGVGFTPVAAAAKTTATITSSEVGVWKGQSFTLTVELEREDRPFADASVTIQARPSETAEWSDAKSIKTNDAGQATFTPGALARNTDFRAFFEGTDDYAASVSPPVTVYAIQSANITGTSSVNLRVGQMLTVDGTTTSALVGANAKLQILDGDDWKTVGSAEVASDATFSIPAEATRAGTPSYRVSIDGLTGISGAISGAVKFNVYDWYPIGEPDSQSDGSWETTDDSVLGTVSPGTGAWGEYSLASQCIKFSSTVGLSDTSNAANEASFIVVSDGVVSDLGTVGTADGKTVEASFKGPSTLRLENSLVAGDSEFGAAWADPQVLCLGAP